MKILLFGKNGQVGSHLCHTLVSLGQVEALSRSEVDLCDPAATEKVILGEKPDVVVNAAAYTAVDKAESEPDLVMAINGEAPAVMARAADQIGAALVHYSTDYVFDGRALDPYTEDVLTHPQSIYGRTKLAGDEAVRTAAGAYLIFRTAWVYSHTGRNFLKTILRLASERDKLRIVDDQVGSPTFAGSIAKATTEVLACVHKQGGLQPAQSGIYHMTCQGSTSWYGFTKRILELARIENVQVEPIATGEYPTPAVRPAYSVLSCEKLKRVFGVQMPHWEQALTQCLVERSLAEQH